MPAVSKKQQRLFGLVRAAQKGTLKGKASPQVQRIASSMKKKDVKKFASTKHKGLPNKKVRKESFNEDYVKELEDGLVKMEYPAYDEVDKLMQKIAKENDIDTTTLHMAFKTKHLMVPDDWAKRKMREPVMIPKTPQIEEKKASKAMDAGARAKRLLLRKEYRAKVSEIIPDELMDSFQINPDAHNKAKRQAKIRNMTKSTNPNEKKVAERKVNDKTQLPKLNTEEQNPEGMKLRDVEKMNRQKKLLDAAKKAPEVKNKIVSANKLREGNLHKWFKGSKSKDGKGGWVNVVTGGTCASDEPGEGTPKCVSSSKRASMTKAERLSASRRKKKADPGQQSKSGGAKPTYVSTDKKKVKKESYIPEEGYDHIKDRIAMSGGDPSSKNKKDATTIKKDYKDYKRKVKGDTNYQKEMRKKYGGRLPSALEVVKAKYGKGDIMDEYVAEKKVMGKIKRSFKRDEYGDPINKDGSYAGKLNVDKNPKDEKITRSEGYVVEAKDLTGNFDKGKKPIKVNLKDLVNKAKNNPKNKNLGIKPPTDTEEVTEAKSAAWQRKAGKSESGGLNAKGVASYRAANPGSKLKTAVTTKPSKLKKGSKAANRRKSFCSRMKGMKSKLTSAKTARDPDSRINKSLRKWNCSFEPETGEMIIERGPQTLGFGTRKSSIHDKKKKSTKKVSGMIKSLKRKGSVLKQSMGPLDASRKASRLKNLRDDVDLTILRLIDEGHMNKTCGEGEYYCYQSKKCKKVPKGMKIGYGGMLKPDKDDSEETKGKNGNGNGNGNGHGGNGNGNGNGGGDGGGE